MQRPRLSSLLATAAAAVAVLSVFASAPACSSSSSSSGAPKSCSADPTACPAGETCWPLDAKPDFGCVASDTAGTFGQSCQNSFGVATCTDGMACDQSTPTNGVCTLYCNATKTCPNGYSCTQTVPGSGDAGITISLCRLTPSTPIGTDEGGGDSGVVLFPDGGIVGGTGMAEAGSPVSQ